MGNYEKVNLLVNIARLYYEHNYSQQMIAEKLKLSRPYVSKLINKARESGLVSIQINDPNAAESQLETEVRQKFNLKKVIAVPENNDEYRLEKVTLAAARYLNLIIEDNDIIGVAWGSTLYSFALNVIPRKDIKNVTVVQLCGGISNLGKNIYASEIPKKISDAYKGIPYILPLPAVVDDKNVKNAIIRDKNINGILEMAKKANIAVFTMGTFGYDGALARADYISSKEVDILFEKGAVGDICSRIINIRGEICDKDLDSRTIAIELDELLEKEYRIGIAYGMNKIKCIIGALKGGYPNVLVTDEETAVELMKMD